MRRYVRQSPNPSGGANCHTVPHRCKTTVRRAVFSIVAATALLVRSLGAAAAAPSPYSSCNALLITGPLGPPGGVQREIHDPHLGGTVAHMARFPGTFFGECFAEFLEVTADH
jgi:hypothetical protein